MSFQQVCLITAKSFVGKNVNLHLRNGTVLVNVLLESIEGRRLKCKSVGHKAQFVPLRDVVLIRSLALVQLWQEVS